MGPQEWKLGSAFAVAAFAVSKWITDAFQQNQDCIQLLKCATSQALLVCYTLARSNRACAKIVTIRVPIVAKQELHSAFVHAHCARPIRVSTH